MGKKESPPDMEENPAPSPSPNSESDIEEGPESYSEAPKLTEEEQAMQSLLQEVEGDQVVSNEKVFRCEILNLVVAGVQVDRPYLKFTLGGNFTVTDNRHKGGEVVKSGKKGKNFQSKTIKKGTGGRYPNHFIKYWKGNYDDLAEQDLTVELWDRNMFRRNKIQGTHKLNLRKLAAGTCQVTFELRNKESRRVAGSLSATVYFEEVFTFDINFSNWRGMDLPCMDLVGTSDPFVEISIPKEWRKMFHSGGMFGRSTASPVQDNTIFPYWEEVGGIKYYGTRSELEDSELVVKCYDYDIGKNNELMGLTRVPMRGLIDHGYVQLGLGKLKTEREIVGGASVKVKRVEPRGEVEGFISCDSLPRFQQFGAVPRMLPGHQYLCVRIESVSRLRATDANGLTDPFVQIEWDGMSHSTRVIKENLNPSFDTVLYFPIRMAGTDPVALGKKGPITLSVYDWDEEGNDFLGSHIVNLHEVTSAKSSKVPDPTCKGGASRVHKNTTAPLMFLGERSGASMSMAAWFWNDFPSHFAVPEAEPEPESLPLEFEKRHETWKMRIPADLKDSEEAEYAISAPDERSVPRFLPTFLTPIVPPSACADPMVVFRMLQCFPYATDEEAFMGAEDVWSSPNFFMTIKKGDSEDHALLLASLFMGLEMDSYVCQGRLADGTEHTWVMTRETTGDVRFWEPALGEIFTLPGRWDGCLEDDEAEAALAALGHDSDSEVSLGDDSDDDLRALDAATDAQLARAIVNAQIKLKEAGKDPEANPEDVTAVGEDGEAAQNPMSKEDLKLLAKVEKRKKRNAERRIKAAKKLQQARAKREATQVKARNMDDLMFFDSDDETLEVDDLVAGEAFNEVRNAPTPAELLKQARADASVEDTPASRLAAAQEAGTGLWASEGGGCGYEYVPTPYGRIETVFNGSNIWANVQHPHTAAVCYDLEDSTKWNPFVTKGKDSSLEVVPFYEPRRVSPPLPSSKVEALVDSIREECIGGITAWRHGNYMETNLVRELTSVLAHGLKLMELLSLCDETNPHVEEANEAIARADGLRRKIAVWRGTLAAHVPLGHQFKGAPVRFSFTDARKIRKFLTEKLDFHEESDKSVRFVFASHVAPYHNGVSSVWVYIGHITHVNDVADPGEASAEDMESPLADADTKGLGGDAAGAQEMGEVAV